ncbi:hypothetical protein C9374_008460 [Naegleria lovaniensis]|uniref:Uncharacterized protein n=1 Tax=Naegleria lovaniensis TaxID=51637 RepID=A0AA88GJ53_NAELO|nr:uncharacterized protein C9374_008460 [Naegleria lovaniensis]KAG2378317.1 hypothetical protein C9374_008460 [Naegleria lovaniensis]
MTTRRGHEEIYSIRLPTQALSYEHLPLGSRIFREGEFQPDLSNNIVPLMLDEVDESLIRKVEINPSIHIHKIISGKSHSHIITMDGMVLSFGTNYFGELCCGFCGPLVFKQDLFPNNIKHKHQNESNNSSRNGHPKGMIQAVGPISNMKIVDGACGMNHSIFVSQDGRVFLNGKSQMKYITSNTNRSWDNISTPMEVDQESCFGSKKQIISVAARNSTSLVLTSNGEIYESVIGTLGEVLPTWTRVIVHDWRMTQPVKLFSHFLSFFSSVLNQDGHVSVVSDKELNLYNTSDVEYIIHGSHCNVVLKLRNRGFFIRRNDDWLDIGRLVRTNDEVISMGICEHSTLFIYTRLGNCLYCDKSNTWHALGTLEFSVPSHIQISASRFRSYIYRTAFSWEMVCAHIEKSFPCFRKMCVSSVGEQHHDGILMLSDVVIKMTS